jgi:hypothetical protein
LKDPDLGVAVATNRGGEPLSLQGSARSEGMKES